MSSPQEPLRPLAPGARLQSLDFLRGIALLGILMVNMGLFFRPLSHAMNLSWLTECSRSDWVAWSVVEGLCAYKFISLFSMLFGFGVAVQLHRVSQAGGHVGWFALRRFGVLMAFGLLHGLLIWYGDVLFMYGVLGLLLTALWRVRPRVLLIIAGILMVLLAGGSLVVLLMNLALPQGVGLPAVPAPEVAPSHAEAARGFQAMQEASFNPIDARWVMAETQAYAEGPWEEAVLFRAASWGFCLLGALFNFGWHSLAMMLLGMWAYHARFWTPERAPLRRRVALVAFGAGVPITLVGLALLWVLGFDDSRAQAIRGCTLQVGALLLPAGYAVLIAGTAAWLPPVLTRAVASAGRMALSVYLLESLTATALSYWWGWGLFDTVSSWALCWFALCIWSGLVVISCGWLGCVRMGPAEWLWRAATYATLHPAEARPGGAPGALRGG